LKEMVCGLSEEVNDTSAVYIYRKIDLQLSKLVKRGANNFLKGHTFANPQTSELESSGHGPFGSNLQSQAWGSTSVPIILMRSSVWWAIRKTHSTLPEPSFWITLRLIELQK